MYMYDWHRRKCPNPIYQRKTSKGWIYIANSCHFVKNALLPNKSVYIDNFNAFNRQNGDSFINSCQRWTLVLWVHIYFVEKNPLNNRLFMFTSHVVYFALGVSPHYLAQPFAGLSEIWYVELCWVAWYSMAINHCAQRHRCFVFVKLLGLSQ